MARILARRLRPILERHLRNTQYCGVPGKNILDAVATVRDVIAYAETAKVPMCVLTLDFQNAFDNISHDYLFAILRSYGLSDQFVSSIRHLYASSVQINGHLHGPIPIRCGVRQGCPLSMTLYVLCLQPLLNILERRISGIRIAQGTRPVSVVAYADEITVFLTSAVDLPVVEDTIRMFERASGARLNTHKSQA
jgi:retron-type reverse transcriptase